MQFSILGNKLRNLIYLVKTWNRLRKICRYNNKCFIDNNLYSKLRIDIKGKIT